MLEDILNVHKEMQGSMFWMWIWQATCSRKDNTDKSFKRFSCEVWCTMSWCTFLIWHAGNQLNAQVSRHDNSNCRHSVPANHGIHIAIQATKSKYSNGNGDGPTELLLVLLRSMQRVHNANQTLAEQNPPTNNECTNPNSFELGSWTAKINFGNKHHVNMPCRQCCCLFWG